MSKKPVTPATLGEMKPGDSGNLPDGRRVMVTGQIDCGTLWRTVCLDPQCPGGNECTLGPRREPDVSPKETPVTDVVTRAATAEGKLGDSDPLRGGAR